MNKPQPERHTAHLDTAPHYWECVDCGFLSDDPLVGAHEKPCHGCEISENVRPFPPDRLRGLDARIRSYHSESDSEIVVILVATFLETLLEDILARIMAAQGASVRLRASVLDTQRSIGQRIGRLFPALTGEQFEDVCAEIGFREFPKRWRHLRSERNAFIHDSAFEGVVESITGSSAEEAMELLDQAYRVFVRINNRFVADGYSSRDKHPASS